jgi:hypothetical protein
MPAARLEPSVTAGFFLPDRGAIVGQRCHSATPRTFADPQRTFVPDSLTSTLTSYYDTVPYDSHPFPQSAMEHLEALAFLFGLDAPAPAKARVLELGLCGRRQSDSVRGAPP